MFDDAGFLKAIRAAPDDLPLRRVYADFLEEQGDPRGEFIRVQCALADLADDDERRPELELRERRLLREYEDQWLQPLRIGVPWRRPRFRAGFVEELSLTAETFLQPPARRLFARTPWRGVQLLGTLRDHAQALGRHKRLATFAVLDLEAGGLEDRDLEAMLARRKLPRLRTLRLGFNHLTDRSFDLLLRGNRLPALKVLDLSHNHLTAIDQGLLVPLSWQPLESLDLSGNALAFGLPAPEEYWPPVLRLSLDAVGLNEWGWQRLLRNRHLAGLTELHLNNNHLHNIPDDLRTATWPALRKLGLSGVLLGDRAWRFRALRPPPWPALRWLDLSRNGLRAGSLDDLVRTSLLTNLITLLLRDNPLRDEGIGLLARTQSFASLRTLDLDGVRMTVEGVEELAAGPHFANLQVLDVSHNELRDAGLLALAGLKNLRRLDVWGAHLTDPGLADFLTAAPPNLTMLGLGWNALTDACLPALTNSALWPRLVALDLSHTQLTETGLATLLHISAPPGLQDFGLEKLPVGEELQERLSAHFEAGVCRF